MPRGRRRALPAWWSNPQTASEHLTVALFHPTALVGVYAGYLLDFLHSGGTAADRAFLAIYNSPTHYFGDGAMLVYTHARSAAGVVERTTLKIVNQASLLAQLRGLAPGSPPPPGNKAHPRSRLAWVEAVCERIAVRMALIAAAR